MILDNRKGSCSIEGAAIVGLDSCACLKPYADVTVEGSGDPLLAIDNRHLQIPCACMTANMDV